MNRQRAICVCLAALFPAGVWAGAPTPAPADPAEICPILPGKSVPAMVVKTSDGQDKETESAGSTDYIRLSDSSMEAARSLGIAFHVSDELVAMYKNKYGIDLEGDSGRTHHLLPVPAALVIGTDGVVRFTYLNPNYKTRVDGEVLRAAARAALQ